MPSCSINSCKNRNEKGFSLYRIPKNPQCRAKWLELIRPHTVLTETNLNNNIRICEIHFSEEQFQLASAKLLKCDAIPDLLRNNLSFNYTNFENAEPNVPTDNDQEVHKKVANDFGNINKNLRNQIRDLKRQLQQQHNEITSLKEKNNLLTSGFSKIFTENQIIFVKNNGSLRGVSSWSNMSIHKALKLYISCGTSEYEEILRQGLPFPTIRKIQRHIQDLKFKPGILTEIIDMLKVKVDHMTSHDKHVTLLVEEMKITPGHQYDISL